MSAVLRADRELWMKAFDKCKSDLKWMPAVDIRLMRRSSLCTQVPEVVFHLLPTPGVASMKRSRSKSLQKATKPKQDRASPHRNTAKGDVRDKKRQSRVMVPKSLKGFSGKNQEKMRICYHYNLPHECSNSTHTKEGQVRCVKGVHQCIKCYKQHPVAECGKSGN